MVDENKNPTPSEDDYSPELIEQDLFAGAVFEVGDYLNRNQKIMPSRPDPTQPYVFMISPYYVNRADIFRAIKIEPLHKEQEHQDDYHLQSTTGKVFLRQRRAHGSKKWVELAEDEEVPEIYQQVIFDAKAKLEDLRTQERAQEVVKKGRGFFRRLRRD